MFKKRNLNKKAKNKVYVNIIGLFAILLVFFVAFFVFDQLKKVDLSGEKIIKSSTGVIQEEVIKNDSFDLGGLIKKIPVITSSKTVEAEPSEKSNFTKEKQREKINLLLLGRGGGNHDAPNLTDSIIFASIHKKHKTVTMLSIPRDLYVDYPGVDDEGKINQIYAINKFKSGSHDKGIEALSGVIEKITGENIDYYVSIDFKGFSSFVDALGGVTITVPETLYDTQYPDGNYGYRTLIIKKGTWLFDGDTALMYARSRHSTSDFDRSLRQQQIISAVRDKLKQGGFLSKVYKIKNFYDVFVKYVETDVDITAMLKIYNELKGDLNYEIVSYNLNDSCFYGDPDCQKGGFLYTPDRDLFGGASVLLPNGAYKGSLSSYSTIHKFMNLIFNHPDLYKEKVEINIFNSTKVLGIAGDLATKLKKYGFEIPDRNSIGNARDKVYLESIIFYDPLIKESKTLKYLTDVLGIEAKPRTTVDPVYSKNKTTQIELILGNDHKNIISNLDDNL